MRAQLYDYTRYIQRFILWVALLPCLLVLVRNTGIWKSGFLEEGLFIAVPIVALIVMCMAVACFKAQTTLQPYGKSHRDTLDAQMLLWLLIGVVFYIPLFHENSERAVYMALGVFMVFIGAASYVGTKLGCAIARRFEKEAEAEALSHLKEALIAQYADAYSEPIEKVRSRFEALEKNWNTESLKEQIAIVEELNSVFSDICVYQDKVHKLDKRYEALREKCLLQM